MAIFKCKMCGGELQIRPGETVAVCEYCGSKQTLPKLDDERRINLFERANHFRRLNEFDKATDVFEHILAEDKTDAEAYWSLVLCRYGVEYVEDPKTKERVPTVNRAQFTSIFADENYKAALEYADQYQRVLYEEEAKAIDEIQKGILSISQKEAPFDIFICYKETDEIGRRTPDSVYAQDIYKQLTKEGYRVFFSRITLEDKIGTAYEPYIFAALHSAKAMVVVGTKPEHFNAVWVKNEWSRYLGLINAGEEKTLIPVYKDMDPYDLPAEFAYIQAQDMAKIGFMQDLLHGIEKIVKKKTPQEGTGWSEDSMVASMLDKVYTALEAGDFRAAETSANVALAYDPQNVKALIGKAMVKAEARQMGDLVDAAMPLEEDENFTLALQNADPALKQEMEEIVREQKYRTAVAGMQKAKKVKAWQKLKDVFSGLGEYKDGLEKVKNCEEAIRKGKAKNAVIWGVVAILALAALVLSAITILWRPVILPQKARDLHAQGNFEEAYSILHEIEREDVVTELKLNEVEYWLKQENYDVAFAILNELDEGERTKSIKYERATKAIQEQNYTLACELLESILDYRDSTSLYDNISFDALKQAAQNGFSGELEINFGAYDQDNDDSNKEIIRWKVLAVEGNKALLISKLALDHQQYNNAHTSVTWETCSLRAWLNSSFLNEAFDNEQQKRIVASTVTADANPSFSTPPGNNTVDKVFLLSITEANKYFSSNEARKCKNADQSTCAWWLRSPGTNSQSVAIVNEGGGVNESGANADYDSHAVRPAIWISLD